MNECKIIAIANQKGGTAKSTTACNLSIALADAGYRVLCVDMDPQANLTMVLGVDTTDELLVTMHDLLTSKMDKQRKNQLLDKSEYIIHSEKVDLIPTNIKLTDSESNLRNEMGGEYILSELLEPLRQDYDYIVIDTSPSIGKLTINALATCDSVIIPVNPQLWSAVGLTDLLQTIYLIQSRINPRIKIDGILMTICDERTILFRDTRDMLIRLCKDEIRIFDTCIPSTVMVGKANYSSVSIMEFDANSKAAIAYTQFAKEVVGHECIYEKASATA